MDAARIKCYIGPCFCFWWLCCYSPYIRRSRSCWLCVIMCTGIVHEHFFFLLSGNCIILNGLFFSAAVRALWIHCPFEFQTETKNWYNYISVCICVMCFRIFIHDDIHEYARNMTPKAGKTTKKQHQHFNSLHQCEMLNRNGEKNCVCSISPVYILFFVSCDRELSFLIFIHFGLPPFL